MFSKVNSDVLSLHRSDIDHEIMLEKDNNLSLSSLYSMLLKQFNIMKIYLKDYLQKEFIVSSDALYASSVLFAKKSKEEWQFYVNYHKLNEIIKKNYYSLSLIEETMTRLARVKIFIKFNI